jgi:thiamine-monophosphate kinase
MSPADAAQTVAALGEFALIDRLAAALAEVGAATAPDLLGIGDDAAIWTPTPGTRAVITTDSLIEGVHFRLDWTGWRDLGHKALAVNLSDIAAMGARPRLAVISLGLTGKEPVAGLLDLYRDLGSLAARYDVIVAGGDIVASPDRLGLHVTVIGESWPDADGRLLTRDSARPGDLLAVSGPLGLSAAGLQFLLWADGSGQKAEGAVPASASLPTAHRLLPIALAAHHRPEPRIDYGRALVLAGGRTAMDLSDGLFGDLAKICARSKVGARVDEVSLPVLDEVRARFPDEWLKLATRGGEDYELLFAVAPGTLARLRARCAEQGLPEPTVIGEVLPAPAAGPPIRLRRATGVEEGIGGGAYDHFRHPERGPGRLRGPLTPSGPARSRPGAPGGARRARG